MPRASFLRLLIVGAALAAAPAQAASYDVGPGQPLAAIGDVPWATLGPGDEVRIHWRAEPYRVKWVIGRSGTAEAPLVVRGIQGPNVERPVISGEDATTPDPLDFTGEARGVLKIGTSNVPDETLPEHIVVEGLEVRSGHPDYQFTDDQGDTVDYALNAAAIFVERARHLVIRDCVITDSANGLFVAAFDGDTRDILIQGNFIHGNGNVGRAFEHNAYTAAIGIVYEYNRFGPPRAGAVGNALKDRSAGLVVRYNWIEGGNRQLDLTEGDDTDAIPAHPSYARTFVYGNVLIEPDGAGNSQIVHYGGDNGVTALYRKGVLHFFHNTVVSLRSGNTTLLRLSTDDETADVRDNVLYVAAQGSRLAMLDETGTLLLGHNWLKPGWVESHSGPADVVDAGGNLEEADPGFADAAAQDYRLVPGAGPIDAGTALHPEALPDHVVANQYARHQSGVARSDAGAPDLGAFAAPEPGAGGALAAALAIAGLARRRGRRDGNALDCGA
ncbi:MAG TPA: right-handed parallel beta-helix repeat-containing protein [Myxococcota bacterium]|nr:right-handed parallel beta-helix repeat-containing protein [Myxococcota bacterium]